MTVESRTCMSCKGEGFWRAGEVPDAVMVKCSVCGGSGRIYPGLKAAPVEERKPFGALRI